MNLIEEERVRITKLFQNNGYYLFNKDYIRFEADTTLQPLRVDLRMIISSPVVSDTIRTPHRQFVMGKVDVLCDIEPSDTDR